jgi:hypothetical protein
MHGPASWRPCARSHWPSPRNVERLSSGTINQRRRATAESLGAQELQIDWFGQPGKQGEPFPQHDRMNQEFVFIDETAGREVLSKAGAAVRQNVLAGPRLEARAFVGKFTTRDNGVGPGALDRRRRPRPGARRIDEATRPWGFRS